MKIASSTCKKLDNTPLSCGTLILCLKKKVRAKKGKPDNTDLAFPRPLSASKAVIIFFFRPQDFETDRWRGLLMCRGSRDIAQGGDEGGGGVG